MYSKIIKKDKDNLIIQWEDEKWGFGQLSIKWDKETQYFILDSELMGIDFILKVFKYLPDDTK